MLRVAVAPFALFTFAAFAACSGGDRAEDATPSSQLTTETDAATPPPPKDARTSDASPEAGADVRVVCAQPETLISVPACPVPTQKWGLDGGADAPWTLISPAKYQFGRCELVALVTEAARDMRTIRPSLSALGIADLSQADGEIPGTDRGEPRHPAPSHTRGFSADITYFRTGGRTLEDSPACPSKTREFCEGPHDVDVAATALLFTRIARTGRLAQIIVDPMMEGDLDAELDRLAGTDVEGAAAARKVIMSGIPFHADHFHVSVSRACNDGRDNDGDGKIDLDDPDCVDELDDEE